MRVIVIGAGPSGLMCAIEASKNGHEVIILEKNEKAGKKIYITGKGRCNITNNCTINEFMKNVVHNNKFLYSAINTFQPSDTIAFFENNGVPLITERGNRVFPVSYKASDITRCLLKECEKYKVKIFYHVLIDSIENNKANLYVDISWFDFAYEKLNDTYEDTIMLIDVLKNTKKGDYTDRILWASDCPVGKFNQDKDSYSNNLNIFKQRIMENFNDETLLKNLIGGNAKKLYAL